MSLLRDIQGAVVASGKPLADALRMAKVLAVRLDSPHLRQWVDQELNGYPPDASLPPYRARRQVPVLGTFLGPGTQANNVPIAPEQVGAPFRDIGLFHVEFREPVAHYETWLAGDTPMFQRPWPDGTLTRLQPQIFEDPDWWCVRAWRMVPRSMITGIVDGVRNRLLELVLDLEQQLPQAGDEPSWKLPPDQLAEIVHAALYAPGAIVTDNSIDVQGSTVGSIAGGQGNVVQQGDTHISQQGTDLTSLLPALRTAVQGLAGQLPAAEAETAGELVDGVEEEAARPQPRPGRIRAFLQSLTGLARGAGEAGSAVIDAVQAINQALGS